MALACWKMLVLNFLELIENSLLYPKEEGCDGDLLTYIYLFMIPILSHLFMIPILSPLFSRYLQTFTIEQSFLCLDKLVPKFQRLTSTTKIHPLLSLDDGDGQIWSLNQLGGSGRPIFCNSHPIFGHPKHPVG